MLETEGKVLAKPLETQDLTFLPQNFEKQPQKFLRKTYVTYFHGFVYILSSKGLDKMVQAFDFFQM